MQDWCRPGYQRYARICPLPTQRLNYVSYVRNARRTYPDISFIGWDEGVMQMKVGEKATLDIS